MAKPSADLHGLDRVDRHLSRGPGRCRACRRSGSPSPGGTPGGDHLDHRTDRGAGLAHAVEIVAPALRRRPVGAEERVLVNRRPVPVGPIDRVGADLDQGAADRDPAAQDLPADRTPRRPASRSPAPRTGRRRDSRGCHISASRSRRHGRAGTSARCRRSPWSAGRHCRCGARSGVPVVTPLEHAGQDLHLVRLAPLGGPARLPPGRRRSSQRWIVGFRQRESRRHAIDHAADGGAPWLSPQVVKRNRVPKLLPAMIGDRPSALRRAAGARTGEVGEPAPPSRRRCRPPSCLQCDSRRRHGGPPRSPRGPGRDSR